MAGSCGLLLVAAGVVCATADRASVSPIQKVLEIMKDMKTKAIADKKDEEIKFSSFTQWCADVTSDKTALIKKASLELDTLEAKIAKAASDIEEAAGDIAQLDTDMAGYEADEKAATDVRTKERADFDAELASYDKVLDQLDRAMMTLKELNQTTPAAGSMLQEKLGALAKSSKMPEHAQKVMTAFIQEVKQPEGLAYEAPEANAYMKQSGGVQEMLLQLKYKFQEEKSNLEKEEMERRSGYQMLVQKLTDRGEGATREKGVKTEFKAKRSSDKADYEGDYASTDTTKKADESYLADTKTLCATKTDEFASRTKLRDGEIEALSKAIEIISSDPVSLAQSSNSASFVQRTALAHLRSVSARNPKLEQVSSFLRQKATMYKSKDLALIAEKALADPFLKVKQMIKALLFKLMEEASSESDHKAYCKAELGTNELTRKHKSAEIEKLQADMESLTAQIGKLTQDVEDLAGDIAEIEKLMAEATKIRKDEKAENLKTIAEAKEGQDALAQAIAVIRDYYAKAGEATALAQQTPGQDAPVTWDSPFKGQQDTATGVFGLLDVIRDDFLRQETSTDSAEDKAQLEYERDMAESSKTKAVKETEMEHKTNKRTTKESMLQSTKSSLTETQTELTAAMDYYEKLKPTCVSTGMTYEERVQSRLAELQSLKEAYQILTGEELPSLSAMKAEQVGLEY